MLALLARPLVGQIAVPVAILLAVFLGVQSVKLHFANGRIDKLEASLKVARVDLKTCQGNRHILEATIAQRNAEVEAAKAESDRRQKELAKARQRAEGEALRADRAASKLASFRPAGADTCARLLAADEAVRGSL